MIYIVNIIKISKIYFMPVAKVGRLVTSKLLHQILVVFAKISKYIFDLPNISNILNLLVPVALLESESLLVKESQC